MAGVSSLAGLQKYQGDNVLDELGLIVLSLKTLQKKFYGSTNFGLYKA